uniref:Putative ovule protein n=1 Tax=Solanum chacoense TaxID=4108 RepID=A0A0V0IBV3_SOLCH
MIKNMTTYVHDEMIKNYETLILYILKDIKIIELRRIIWKKIFNDNESEDILNQQGYEIDLHDLGYERIEWYDLEINLD